MISKEAEERHPGFVVTIWKAEVFRKHRIPARVILESRRAAHMDTQLEHFEKRRSLHLMKRSKDFDGARFIYPIKLGHESA